MEPAVARPHVTIITRRRVNDGRGRMIRRGRECVVSDRRAAELVAFGFADVPLPEDRKLVLAVADAELQAIG
jgi:hypothetical protein